MFYSILLINKYIDASALPIVDMYNNQVCVPICVRGEGAQCHMQLNTQRILGIRNHGYIYQSNDQLGLLVDYNFNELN